MLTLPASELEIVSPVLRRLAEALALRVNRELLEVEFNFVYQRKKILAGWQRGIVLVVQDISLVKSCVNANTY